MHYLNVFGVSKIFKMFFEEVSYAHHGYIYLIKNTVTTLILWNIISIYNTLSIWMCFKMYSCDLLNFQHHYFSLHCHNDPSEIILNRKYVLLQSMLKTAAQFDPVSNSFLHTQGQSLTRSYNNRWFYDWFICSLSRGLNS